MHRHRYLRLRNLRLDVVIVQRVLRPLLANPVARSRTSPHKRAPIAKHRSLQWLCTASWTRKPCPMSPNPSTRTLTTPIKLTVDLGRAEFFFLRSMSIMYILGPPLCFYFLADATSVGFSVYHIQRFEGPCSMWKITGSAAVCVCVCLLVSACVCVRVCVCMCVSAISRAC